MAEKEALKSQVVDTSVTAMRELMHRYGLTDSGLERVLREAYLEGMNYGLSQSQEVLDQALGILDGIGKKRS